MCLYEFCYTPDFMHTKRQYEHVLKLPTYNYYNHSAVHSIHRVCIDACRYGSDYHFSFLSRRCTIKNRHHVPHSKSLNIILNPLSQQIP